MRVLFSFLLVFVLENFQLHRSVGMDVGIADFPPEVSAVMHLSAKIRGMSGYLSDIINIKDEIYRKYSTKIDRARSSTQSMHPRYQSSLSDLQMLQNTLYSLVQSLEVSIEIANKKHCPIEVYDEFICVLLSRAKVSLEDIKRSNKMSSTKIEHLEPILRITERSDPNNVLQEVEKILQEVEVQQEIRNHEKFISALFYNAIHGSIRHENEIINYTLCKMAAKELKEAKGHQAQLSALKFQLRKLCTFSS